MLFLFFKQKTAYEMRISDWSSDVCSSDLLLVLATSVWTFNESGLDIWAMLPRLGCLGLLAMALLILTIKGAFGGRPMNAKELAGSAALLLLILFMPIAGLVVASASPVATTVLRADLPSQEAGAGDDWTDYGGTPEGLDRKKHTS